MGRLFNRGKQTLTRKHLRNNSTKAERLLWARLKCSQVLEFKFRRQQGVGSYILDFYCPEVMLAIEVDGETHVTDDQLEYDKNRQHEIECLGLTALRVTNRDICVNLDGVMEMISNRLLELKLAKQSIEGEASTIKKRNSST
jgi:very-short-patch-repair endonuclease